MSTSRQLAIVCFASFGMLLLGSAQAIAGTYVIRSCNVPDHAPVGVGPWIWLNPQYGSSYNACASGSGFGVAFNAAREMAPLEAGSLVLQAPEAGTPSAIDIRQVKLWMRAALSGSGSSLFVLSRTNSAERGIEQTDIAGPPGAAWTTTPWLSPTYAPGVQRFSLLLLCSMSTYDPCRPAEAIPLLVTGAEVSLSEQAAPQIAGVGGSIVSELRRGGIQTLTFEARDPESGIARVDALLGGRLVASEDFTHSPRCTYQSWNACDVSINGDLSIDTSTVPDGTYTVQLRATDAAGNSRTVQLPQPAIVANDVPQPEVTHPNGVGASREARLVARFAGSGGQSLTTNWRTRNRIVGRLTDATGSPISGASVEVSEIPAPRCSLPRKRTVRTDAQGTFVVSLRARFCSRRIRLSYRADPLEKLPASLRDLRLRVRAAVSLKVRLRGVNVTYSGSINSRPIFRDGERLLMQGRAVGGAWQTFAVRRVSASGRFRGRYTLRVRRPGVVLQFRARVPGETGSPYVAGTSARITVRVR